MAIAEIKRDRNVRVLITGVEQAGRFVALKCPSWTRTIGWNITFGDRPVSLTYAHAQFLLLCIRVAPINAAPTPTMATHRGAWPATVARSRPKPPD
jgi:hypothetical protein